MVRAVESDQEFRPLEVSRRGWRKCIDLPSGELLLPLGLICCRPTKYHVEMMLWIWERRATLLLVLVPNGGTLRWVLDVPLYVVLQGVTVFCRVFPFR